MEIRKILFATDLEDQSLALNLLKQVLSLQKLGLEQIFFLQTMPFDSWMEKLSATKVKVKTIIDENLSLSRMLETAEEEDVSLIVTHLSKNKAKTSNGLIIKKLMRQSTRPILFANDTGVAEVVKTGLFSHIIFATDWSLKSEKALRYLLGLKWILGELEIIHVIDRKLTVRDMRELKEKLVQTRKKFLNEKIDAESHIYAGKTLEEIMTAAKDYKGTMIVVGGDAERRGIERLFKKSSSWKIANEATLPVLVIN
jgi:nucleotide-binding universal stress UspA family protein